MRSGRSIASLALLLALCAGCGRRRPAAAPPRQAQAPSLPTPAQTAQMIPPLPSPPPYSQATVMLNTAIPPEPKEAAHPRHRPFHHRAQPPGNRQPAAKTAPQPAPSNQQLAAGGQPSGDSPIGQLSTPAANVNPTDRQAIAKLVNDTDNGLKAIKRPLSAKEQKTAAQIRTFIQHARASLEIDDLEGARTLAVKAHLLLQELIQQQD